MTPSLVLVVDDFDDARELYCACLEQAGYRTAEARNGLEAVERALEVEPDVVLLDLAMPVHGWRRGRAPAEGRRSDA